MHLGLILMLPDELWKPTTIPHTTVGFDPRAVLLGAVFPLVPCLFCKLVIAIIVGCLPRVSGMDRVKNLTHRGLREPLELFVLSSTWAETFSGATNPLHKILHNLESVKGAIILTFRDHIHFCVAICGVTKKDRYKIRPDSWILGSSATFLWIRFSPKFF